MPSLAFFIHLDGPAISGQRQREVAKLVQKRLEILLGEEIVRKHKPNPYREPGFSKWEIDNVHWLGPGGRGRFL